MQQLLMQDKIILNVLDKHETVWCLVKNDETVGGKWAISLDRTEWQRSY